MAPQPKRQSTPEVETAVRAFQLQRDLDAREAHLKLSRVIHDVQTSGLARSFFDLIDESTGPHNCHPWRGKVNKTWELAYDNGFGEFLELEDILGTSLAHRIAVILWFGMPIPDKHDIYPACGEHLCCNVHHLKIRPHEGRQSRKIGVPVTEFFCREAVAA